MEEGWKAGRRGGDDRGKDNQSMIVKIFETGERYAD